MKRIWGILVALGLVLGLFGPSMAASDKVTLAWEQDMTVPVVGWRVYRSETAGTYGTEPFQQVVWNGTPAPEYVASASIPVQAGTMKVFYWVVTAYNAEGESGRSNEVSTTHDFRVPVVPVTLKATVVRVP